MGEQSYEVSFESSVLWYTYGRDAAFHVNAVRLGRGSTVPTLYFGERLSGGSCWGNAERRGLSLRTEPSSCDY